MALGRQLAEQQQATNDGSKPTTTVTPDATQEQAS